MSSLLFVYGTLRDVQMRVAVLGHAIDRRLVASALAPGYRTVVYPGLIYPAIVAAPGAVAPGDLLIDLPATDLQLLDAFEGAEYRRGALPVLVDGEIHLAAAYLPVARIAPDAPAWSLDEWRALHKPGMLPADGAAAAAIRTALRATRPH